MDPHPYVFQIPNQFKISLIVASTKTKALNLVQVSWQTNFQRAKNSPFFRMLILFQLGISSLGERRALSRNPNSQKRFFSINRFRFQTELGGGGGGLCTLDSKLYLSTAPLHQMFSFTTEAKNGQCLMRFYIALHFSSLQQPPCDTGWQYYKTLFCDSKMVYYKCSNQQRQSDMPNKAGDIRFIANLGFTLNCQSHNSRLRHQWTIL